MGKKKRGLVDTQRLDEAKGDVNSYERRIASDGFESPLANPDCLAERDTVPTSPQRLMGEAVAHLQGRQKEAYLLVMREDRSMAEAAEILNVSKSAVQIYLNRAIAFITNYCRAAEAQGRI